MTTSHGSSVMSESNKDIWHSMDNSLPSVPTVRWHPRGKGMVLWSTVNEWWHVLINVYACLWDCTRMQINMCLCACVLVEFVCKPNVCVCVSVCLVCVCLYVYLCVCVCLLLCVVLCFCVLFCVAMCVFLSVSTSIALSIYLYVYMYPWTFVCVLAVSLSVHPRIRFMALSQSVGQFTESLLVGFRANANTRRLKYHQGMISACIQQENNRTIYHNYSTAFHALVQQ